MNLSQSAAVAQHSSCISVLAMICFVLFTQTVGEEGGDVQWTPFKWNHSNIMRTDLQLSFHWFILRRQYARFMYFANIYKQNGCRLRSHKVRASYEKTTQTAFWAALRNSLLLSSFTCANNRSNVKDANATEKKQSTTQSTARSPNRQINTQYNL